MTFGSVFGRTFSPTFKPHSQAAVASSTDWWLQGGISASNAIVVYQPKGAANYNASLINLANSGTYNAVAFSTAPTFDTSYGWYYNNNQYMYTPFQGQDGNKYSVIIRFTDSRSDTYGWLFGGRTSANNNRFSLMTSMNTDDHGYEINSIRTTYGARVSGGVLCNASGKLYLDGSYETGDEVALDYETVRLGIGCQNYGTGTADDAAQPANGFIGKIQALAIYDIALSPTQVAALTTAMNAL